MKKVRGAKSNKFHDELGGAIAALANSAKIAGKRAALRNNAAKVSDAEFVGLPKISVSRTAIGQASCLNCR